MLFDLDSRSFSSLAAGLEVGDSYAKAFATKKLVLLLKAAVCRQQRVDKAEALEPSCVILEALRSGAKFKTGLESKELDAYWDVLKEWYQEYFEVSQATALCYRVLDELPGLKLVQIVGGAQSCAVIVDESLKEKLKVGFRQWGLSDLYGLAAVQEVVASSPEEGAVVLVSLISECEHSEEAVLFESYARGSECLTGFLISNQGVVVIPVDVLESATKDLIPTDHCGSLVCALDEFEGARSFLLSK